MKKLVSLAALTALLAACVDTGATKNGEFSSAADGFGEEVLVAEPTVATPAATAAPVQNNDYLMAAAPKYYIGNAYKVDTVQYIPVEDLSYNQTGMAGVIPAELNNTKTSNGEIFDMNQMVATSKTLPLPTIAKVTNLENGQSTVVRINNRGPFVNTRIMDLSPAAAARIGLTGQAKVQVQVMSEESVAVKNATNGTTVAPAPVATEAVVITETTTASTAGATPAATSGEYSVQVAAFYAQESADALAARMATYGDAAVVQEGDMYKVRIVGLDATKARSVIDSLRNNEGMAPGLLKNGRWVNADSI